MPKFHVVAGSDFKDSTFKDKKNDRRVSKVQGYPQKREREEFKRQLVREVSTLKLLLF